MLAAEAASWDTGHVVPAEPGDIPVIDVADWLRESAASGLSPSSLTPSLATEESPARRDRLAAVAEQLGDACRTTGFFSLVGHNVDPSLRATLFDYARRFHALELDQKLQLAMDQPNAPGGVGYLPVRHRKLPQRATGNENAAFIIKRDIDLPLSANLWPAEALLPGFRAALERYAQAMEDLGRALLPLYAASLGVPADYFSEAFTNPLYRLRLTHYPPIELTPDRFGIAPHVDTTFCTILAQNEPGLAVFSERRKCWVSVPMLENAFVVNTGELLKQWTNDEFVSVKHFANHTATQGGKATSRYSIPFFFNATSNHVMTCIPTCTGPGRPAQYPPVSYAESQGVVQGE